MDIVSLWSQTLQLLEKSLSDVTFQSMIKPIQPINLEKNILTLKTNNDFFKIPIQRHIPEVIRCLRTVSNKDIDVTVVSPEDFGETGASGSTSKPTNTNYTKTNLRSKYVFETFVKGKSNELAYAAAKAVAESEGRSSYNPLFLYGGVGLGKTHLIHSIGNQVFELNPSMKIMYVSTETFVNEFIHALREETTQKFKNKYRDIDLLLIDDIQFLEGKNQTQEELFHTFNTLYNDSKQIVLTSDQPPKELTMLEKRLTSRFAMGLTVDITLPDYETRAAILEKKLDMERLVIPQEVKEFISKNIVSNIRDLEGALNKVTAYAKLTSTPITLTLAEKALKDVLVGNAKPDITVPYIQETVAAHFKVTVEDLNGRKRSQNIVYPRHIAMYLSRKILDISLPDVGVFFGNRDHTTVIHGCDKIAVLVETDENLQGILHELEKKIKGE